MHYKKSINKNQTSSKHIEKKRVLSLRLNELTVSASPFIALNGIFCADV